MTAETVPPLTRYFLLSQGFIPRSDFADVVRLQQLLREGAAVLAGPLETVAFWKWVSGERDASWLELPPANQIGDYWREFCAYAESYRGDPDPDDGDDDEARAPQPPLRGAGGLDARQDMISQMIRDQKSMDLNARGWVRGLAGWHPQRPMDLARQLFPVQELPTGGAPFYKRGSSPSDDPEDP